MQTSLKTVKSPSNFCIFFFLSSIQLIWEFDNAKIQTNANKIFQLNSKRIGIFYESFNHLDLKHQMNILVKKSTDTS